MPNHLASSVPLLVTGTEGRVGSLLRAAWAAEPSDDIHPVWCARGYGPWQDLSAGPLDPCSKGAVILHLAADLSDAPDALARSVGMARAVATAARRGRARHIFLASSAAVYSPADTDLGEAAACCPATPYGHAKLLAEAACREAAAEVPVTALRIGNIVGAGALLGVLHANRFVTLDPVPGQPGGPMRSWIAPGQLARALGQLARLAVDAASLPPVLNLASPTPWSMASLLDAAGFAWGYGPYRSSVLPRLTLDCARLADLCPRITPASPREMIDDWRKVLAGGVAA